MYVLYTEHISMYLYQNACGVYHRILKLKHRKVLQQLYDNLTSRRAGGRYLCLINRTVEPLTLLAFRFLLVPLERCVGRRYILHYFIVNISKFLLKIITLHTYVPI